MLFIISIINICLNSSQVVWGSFLRNWAQFAQDVRVGSWSILLHSWSAPGRSAQRGPQRWTSFFEEESSDFNFLQEEKKIQNCNPCS